MAVMQVQVRHVMLTPPPRSTPGCPNFGYRLEQLDGTSLRLGLFASYDHARQHCARAGWSILRLLSADGQLTPMPEQRAQSDHM